MPRTKRAPSKGRKEKPAGQITAADLETASKAAVKLIHDCHLIVDWARETWPAPNATPPKALQSLLSFSAESIGAKLVDLLQTLPERRKIIDRVASRLPPVAAEFEDARNWHAAATAVANYVSNVTFHELNNYRATIGEIELADLPKHSILLGATLGQLSRIPAFDWRKIKAGIEREWETAGQKLLANSDRASPWDSLYKLHDEMKAADPTVTDAAICREYKRKYKPRLDAINQWDEPTVEVLREHRKYRKQRSL